MLGSGVYNRFAMLAMTPLSVAFCLLFFTIIINSLFQVLCPIKDIRSGNSHYHSLVKPDYKNHRNIKCASVPRCLSTRGGCTA